MKVASVKRIHVKVAGPKIPTPDSEPGEVFSEGINLTGFCESRLVDEHGIGQFTGWGFQWRAVNLTGFCENRPSPGVAVRRDLPPIRACPPPVYGTRAISIIDVRMALRGFLEPKRETGL